MIGFVSYAQRFQTLFNLIVSSDNRHAKWLNTLSFLENCGARKIAACEHPTMVKEEILKHAAEEFRHAHYLKKQISKVTIKPLETYHLSTILGGVTTLHYLKILDLKTVRYLKNLNFSTRSIKEIAYLLVTYAIELRAEELYPLYDQVLKNKGSKIRVKSILLEEKEHLNEMRENLQKLPDGFLHAQQILKIESQLCAAWVCKLELDLSLKYKERNPADPKKRVIGITAMP